MRAVTIVLRILYILLVVTSTVFSGCVNTNVSLEKPIRVVLSDKEVLELEASLRDNKFTSNDMKGALIFEGLLERKETDSSGEVVYQFRIVAISKTAHKTIANEVQDIISLISPSLQNGGVVLDVGRKYKVYAPQLPDGRFGVWRGLIIPE